MGERPLRLSRPKSTIRLDNLAQLSHALNRLVEAEPLMSRMVEILLRFTQTTGSPHPNLHAAYGNHAGGATVLADTVGGSRGWRAAVL